MNTVRLDQRPGRQRVLIGCGLVAALLYVATDLIGGLRYPGYSFLSQVISELGAIGAPSKSIVDPLFTVYGILALAFGAGVVRAAEHNRALRITGILIAAHATAGLAASLADRLRLFPASFSMHERGASNLTGDLPHILLTATIVLCLAAAMAFGAFALGKRFRIFSLAMLLLSLAAGALTSAFAPGIARGEATHGAGLVERIDVYAVMLWLAVLSIALLKRRRGTAVAVASARVPIGGSVAPGFEEVRAAFERNFAERGEIGAAVAAYWRGEKVVDLWGGRRLPNEDAPWTETTMIAVNSTTKGLAAMTLAIANARGWLDYDAPIARYWPEFAQNGKAPITVRQLLGHEAGLVLLDEPLSIGQMRDLDAVARLLARQKPAWVPGTRHGYHAMSIGLYMQELIRRVDPAHRTLGRFFHEEIAEPLGLDFYIGLPPEIPDSRLAKVQPLSIGRALLALTHSTPALIRRVLWPWSLLRQSLSFPTGADFNDRRTLEVELPAGNGVGTARAIARAYAAFAEGGGELGITPQTFAAVTAPPDPGMPNDVVLGVPTSFSLGFTRPGAEGGFGSSARSFGTMGAGGSFGFADPDAHVGYAYVMNKLDFYLFDDPREKALRDALYRAIHRLQKTQLIPDSETVFA